MGLQRRRADLRAAYPDPLGADRFAFARWTRETGAREHGLPGTLDVRAGRRGMRAAVTIVGRNRLPAARVLAASLRVHAPEVAFHIVVADEPGPRGGRGPRGGGLRPPHPGRGPP